MINLRLGFLSPRDAEMLYDAAVEVSDLQRGVPLGERVPVSPETVEVHLKEMRRSGSLAIGIFDSLRLIGSINFHRGDRGEVEVGYWLVPSFRGRGLMKLALHQALRLPEVLPLVRGRRISAGVDADNLASRAVLVHCEFEPSEGKFWLDPLKLEPPLPEPAALADELDF